MITAEGLSSGGWRLPVLLLMAIGIGVGIGLVVSWVVWPVEYVDVAPASLMSSHREEYLILISLSYAYNRDLGLAQSRLTTLGDSITAGSQVVTLAEKYASEGGDVESIRALTALAYALGFRRAALAPYLPDFVPTATWTPWPMPTKTFTPPATATMTPLPTATIIPSPVAMPSLDVTLTQLPPFTATIVVTVTEAVAETQVPTATPTHTQTPDPTPPPTVTPIPVPRYAIVDQRRLCDPPGGQLRVTVLNNAGEPKPNVELLVRWDGQDEHFYTGLKPESGSGYADFTMQKGLVYELVIVGVESDVAQGLVADECAAEQRLASWDVVFRFNEPDQ